MRSDIKIVAELQNEFVDISIRALKLYIFIEAGSAIPLSVEEEYALIKQYEGMNQYANALIDRIILIQRKINKQGEKN